MTGLVFNTRKDIFADRRVREALTLYRAADEALYRAKEAGRSRIYRAATDPDLRFHIAAERADVARAALLALGVQLDVTASRRSVSPGDTISLQLALWNGGEDTLPVRPGVRIDRGRVDEGVALLAERQRVGPVDAAAEGEALRAGPQRPGEVAHGGVQEVRALCGVGADGPPLEERQRRGLERGQKARLLASFLKVGLEPHAPPAQREGLGMSPEVGVNERPHALAPPCRGMAPDGRAGRAHRSAGPFGSPGLSSRGL